MSSTILTGSTGGVRDKMNLNSVGAGFDARNPQRPGSDAQPMAIQQRSGGIRQQPEAIDQFTLHVVQLVIARAIRQAFV